MIKTYSGLAAAGLAAAVALSGCGAEPRPVPPLPRALNTQQRITAASPGVVAIKVRTKDESATGTGWMVGPREVLTAGHVTANAENIKVRFQDGTVVPARLKGENICSDRALLELTQDPPKGTVILPMSDGDLLASNSHLDLLHYGTVGAKKWGTQSLSTSPLTVANPNVASPDLDASFARLTNLIQLQGVLVPGASGAPTIDENGRVTGMFVIGETKSSQGYALPIGAIRKALPALRGGDRHDSLGVELTPLSQLNLNSVYGNDPDYGKYGRRFARLVAKYVGTELRRSHITGMYVQSTADDSPAFNKVPTGSLITRVNGVRVSSLRGVCGVLESAAPGDRITVRGVNINNGTKVDDLLEPWTVRLTTRS